MRYQLGRVGTVFAAVEGTYDTAPGFAATDAIRHTNINLNYSPRNRVDAPTRHVHPDQVYRRNRRATGTWTIRGEFFPSGTLNTLPDHTDFLEHALGAKTNVALSTTVASGPSTTGATLVSVVGLVVRGPVLISIAAGAFAGKYVRWIATLPGGAAVTWEPALPAAPVAGDTVKSCTGYKCATDIASALNIGHYLTDLSYQGYGCVIDSLKIMFDANNEVFWEASGPLARRARPAATAQPGAFTVVGTTPPSGLTGGMYVDNTLEDYIKAEFSLVNGLELDNFAGGTSRARGFYRKGKRQISVNLNTMVSDDVTLLDLGENNADSKVLVQAGDTEGSIIACYCPVVEYETPADPDSDETMEWAYQGHAKATIAGNDGYYIAVA